MSQQVIAHIIMEKRVFELLQNQGHLFPDPNLILREEYRASYQWMARQMEDRLRPPLPGCPAWPMWAWIRHDGFEVPPPIERSSDFVTASIRFHPGDVLISEVGSWEEIQMNFIVADRHQEMEALNAEHEAFFQKCTEAGCSIAENLYPEPLQREIELTWDRIFDVRPSDNIVQATFFSISAENVMEVRDWDAPTSRRRRIIEGQQPDAQFLSQTASSAYSVR